MYLADTSGDKLSVTNESRARASDVIVKCALRMYSLTD